MTSNQTGLHKCPNMGQFKTIKIPLKTVLKIRIYYLSWKILY